jgi:hypothetical protein
VCVLVGERFMLYSLFCRQLIPWTIRRIVYSIVGEIENNFILSVLALCVLLF